MNFQLYELYKLSTSLPPGQQVAIGCYNKYGEPRIYMNAFIICRWQFAGGKYWSSSEYSSNNAWNQNFNNGNQNNNNYVRAVRGFKQTELVLREIKTVQLSLFDNLPEKIEPEIDLSELFEAYFDCRKTKRNTYNALTSQANPSPLS